VEEQLLGRKRLEQDTRRIRTLIPQFVPLTTQLTSTDFTLDTFSTTAKTLLDLSSAFSAPAGIRAAVFKARIFDSGSAAGTCYLILSPNNTAGEGQNIECSGLPNSVATSGCLVVPCDANGDIYYQIGASGAGTMTITLEIWAYWL